MRARPAIPLLLAALAGCGDRPGSPLPSPSAAPALVAPVAPPEAPASSAPPPASASLPSGDEDRAELRRQSVLMFPDLAARKDAESRCLGAGGREPATRCLLDRLFGGDAAGATKAKALHDQLGVLIALGETTDMDGGYRGLLHLVPELPTGRYARHLDWVIAALGAHAAFFAALGAGQAGAMRYKPLPDDLRFFRSVGRHTPAAFAEGRTVSYNVEGSLNTSASAVDETLFHEVFHLNDQDHGGWSRGALGALFDKIVARCGAQTACLAPYAPGTTTVRGGTYYAFQPGNGVAEYAAELALRYYLEQRAALAGSALRRPFKCRRPENAEAYARLAGEFFGGVDRTPPCAP